MAEQTTEYKSSYATALKRFNEVRERYGSHLPMTDVMDAYYGAGMEIRNNPQFQNKRIKSISTLPVDISKDDIGAYLRNPYGSEIPLRQTSQVLRFTAYPYFKITKTYADIPTYRHCFKPIYLDGSVKDDKQFWREARLLDKFNKTLRPDICAHKIAGQAVTLGKVFYTLRYDVDKSHGTVNYAFMQQLPEDRCIIIGYNNISGYTISFDMMYFAEPGTDWRQYGDLFAPYIDGFNEIFVEPKMKGKAVYESDRSARVKIGNQTRTIYPEQVNNAAEGSPRIWQQNGRWAYFVTLPIDKVWTFDIDDTTPAVISPLSGLMLTYSQQADFENAQLALILNPLAMVLTGEIPFYDDSGAKVDDAYRVSDGGRALFETYFNEMMLSNNTSGASFFSAPFKDIKSHKFDQSANANEISESFIRYSMEKAGLSGLIPVAEDVKAGQVDKSALIEARFITATIYPQFERMMNYVYATLNLNYTFDFKMFGTIFTEKDIRERATADLDKGDISAYLVLAALDGDSWLDKLSALRLMKDTGIMQMLEVPQTAYTQSKAGAGRPSKDISELGNSGESTEDTIDSRGEA